MAVLFHLAGCSGGGGSGSATASVAAADNSGPGVQSLTLSVLSSRPERVTGDSVLVDLGVDVATAAVTVTVDGRDVSSRFQPDALRPGRRLGLVDGLASGEHVLLARSGAASTRLTITAYPIAGPVISGTHEKPFVCQTDQFALPDGSTLGPAVDADCMAPTRISYLYRPRGATDLQPLPDAAVQSGKLPADVDTTTTLAGKQVPFVVRLETRVVNRGIDQSAVLHDPTREADPSPWAPPRGWNRRLIAIQGTGCGTGWYVQGARQGSAVLGGLDFRLLSPERLGEGYALVTNTLQHGANNCNVLLAAETAMMSKERFVKAYGMPDFTVSGGCSAGSYGSLQAADMVPGLYDGLLVECTYPDVLTSTQTHSDARLLARYWAVLDRNGFTTAQQLAVSGYKALGSLRDAVTQAGRADPVQARPDIEGYDSGLWSAAVPASMRYSPRDNPRGARPTIYDVARNVYGVDAVSGFALRPFDNVGVQYGLAALNAGAIGVDQFLRLNENIGGYDQDAGYVTARSHGDEGAISRAEQVGLLLSGSGGLASIPIMDVSGIYGEDAEHHLQWFHFALKARLQQANGHSDNLVMWRGQTVPPDRSWATFIAWVEAVHADKLAGSPREKINRAKPAAAVDGCWPASDSFIAETQALGNTAATRCNALFPSWTSPRQVAGAPLAGNILKCSLRAPQPSDYSPAFSDEQWQRLGAVFPQGVCDWSRAGQARASFVPGASVGPSPLLRVFDPGS